MSQIRRIDVNTMSFVAIFQLGACCIGNLFPDARVCCFSRDSGAGWLGEGACAREFIRRRLLPVCLTECAWRCYGSVPTETCPLPFAFKLSGFSDTEEVKYSNALVTQHLIKERLFWNTLHYVRV